MLPSGLGAKMSLAHAIKSEVEMGLWKRSLEERRGCHGQNIGAAERSSKAVSVTS